MVARPGLPDEETPDAHFVTYGLAWLPVIVSRTLPCGAWWQYRRVYSASTSFFPSDSIGIIVLSNQNASAVTGIVRNIIADRLFGLSRIDWNGRSNAAEAKSKASAKEGQKNKTSNKKEGTKPSHSLKDYEGLYNHPGYGTVEVVTKR